MRADEQQFLIRTSQILRSDLHEREDVRKMAPAQGTSDLAPWWGGEGGGTRTLGTRIKRPRKMGFQGLPRGTESALIPRRAAKKELLRVVQGYGNLWRLGIATVYKTVYSVPPLGAAICHPQRLRGVSVRCILESVGDGLFHRHGSTPLPCHGKCVLTERLTHLGK